MLYAVLTKTPLHADDKNGRENNSAFDAEIIGKVILETMVNIGRKSNAGRIFKILI